MEGGITTVPGFLAAGVRAGIKRRGLDLMLISCRDGAVPAAGAFTTNKIKGAPVILTQRHIRGGKIGAIVANSGISNVFTGKRGMKNAERMAELAAQLLNLRKREVAVASTGIIGVQLPISKIEKGIRMAVRELSDTREASLNAAKAIMTTDTFPKEAAARVELEDGTAVTVAGIAKGAGMICPRMKCATMLAFIVTDARITPEALREAVGQAVDSTFNMLNIDGDMSTSDMVIAMANGRAGNREITPERMDKNFLSGLVCVMDELAWMIARDGEGATKVVQVHVVNARTEEEARRAAKTIVGSNLVKAAIFGRDPNWGRVVAALGYSGVHFKPSKLTLEFESERGRVLLVRGENPPTRRLLMRARDILKSREVEIRVNLGVGKERATALGCDLTYDYVRINSRYTT